MTSVQVQPAMMATTAANVAQIGSAINSAQVTAANWTTGVTAAAGDEVSAAAASLFSIYAQEYQAVIGQAGVFHDQFAQLLATAGNAYAETEAAAFNTLNGFAAHAQAEWARLAGSGEAAVGTIVPFDDPPVAVSLIMGGSGTATPSQTYVENAYNLFIKQNFPLTTTPVFNSNLLPTTTAEGLYPFTGVKDLTLDISLARGVTALDNAIQYQLGLGNSPVNVFGYSQSSIVASLEMSKLVNAHVPTTDVTFTLIANPANPNGGLLSRFPGLELPSLGLTFGTATPSDTGYQTVMYTREYDGFADFPRFPINGIADLNALMGIVTLHGGYLHLTPAEIAGATQLATSPGYDGGTTYYMIPTEHLPLLAPLRAIPYFGEPLADLIEPDMRAIVNWGYGDPAYGYSTSYADVATPFGFLPPLSATTALGPALVSGTQQGMNDAFATMQLQGPPTLPALPALSVSGISGALTSQHAMSALAMPTTASVQSGLTNFLTGIETVNTNVVNGLTGDFSTAYATLLPTADIATAVFISLPAYDFQLFINGLIQAVNGDPVGGLINAIGNPLAANVGLVTLASGFELITVANSLQTIITGVPNPGP